MNLSELLSYAVKNKASDLHLSAELPPILRIDGELRRMDLMPLGHTEIICLIEEIMDAVQKKEYQDHLEVDFSFTLAELARFRVNVFTQSRGIAAVFRIIPLMLLSLSDLQLPTRCTELVHYPHGLVLVTGATGSGKSTTLAALIHEINMSRSRHIVTIEDPIEFIHHSNKSLINQRQVHRDTHSFNAALRSALREDPDVILIGELRDLETIRLALTAAETGHLVFATLHTSSATKAINRIIDVFPAEEKAVVRTMLSESLQGVIAQCLVKKAKGGRIAALEIMHATPAIRNLIREDKVAQMLSVIQTGQAKGMHTMDQHLSDLVQKNIIARSEAVEFAVDKNLF